MTTALAKIIARKNAAAEKKQSQAVNPPVRPPTSPLEPCPTCGSAIRWLNAAGVPRCIGCQPPKFAALMRSREVLVIRDQSTGERAWERLVELPDGRLASETGIRELLACGELDPLTAARVGVGGNVEGTGDRENFDRWREIDPDEYFESVRARQNSPAKRN